MTENLTSAQMRAIEAAAIESGSVTGLDLMERAGAAVVAAMLAEWPALADGGHRALVLCGPGNNGGDGYVIARLLAERGWTIEALAWGPPDRMSPDARAVRARWEAMGSVEPIEGLGDFGPLIAPDVIIDALFGTGMTRPLPVPLSHILIGITEWRHRRQVWPLVVAVDLPSGVQPDTGLCPEEGLRAGLTVTFHAAKHGHVLAPDLCGKVVVADIGLGPWDPHRHDA